MTHAVSIRYYDQREGHVAREFKFSQVKDREDCQEQLEEIQQ